VQGALVNAMDATPLAYAFSFGCTLLNSERAA
jgi:hypothetical protein